MYVTLVPITIWEYISSEKPGCVLCCPTYFKLVEKYCSILLVFTWIENWEVKQEIEIRVSLLVHGLIHSQNIIVLP